MENRAGTHMVRTDPSALTDRQQQVLRMVERGLTNGQIADALGITLDGAKFHVSEILAKLDVSTREEAVEAWRNRRWRNAGWLPVPLGKWLAVVAAGTSVAIVVVGVLALLGGGDDDGGRTPPPASADRVAAPSTSAVSQPTAQWGEADLATCPDVPPAVHNPNSIVDWVPFVQFNGTMYLPTGEPAKVITTAPFGRVARNISDTNVKPGQFVDCDSTSLAEGTVLYAVDGFDPRFRVATIEGYLYQADSSHTASTGAELYDLAGKTVQIEVTWRGETSQRSGVFTEPATLRLIEDAILAAPYRPDDSDALGSDGYWITFTFFDGTHLNAGLSSKTGHFRYYLNLPPAIVALLISAAPPE